MPLLRLFFPLCLLCSLASTTVIAAQDTEPELNKAQKLIFLGEHLRQTAPGQTLVYAFTSNVNGQATKSDEVKMTVTGVVDDARRDLAFEFLSGDDRMNFPDAHGYRGNPIVVQFLERDIRDMSRQTGTPIAYLRNTIRRAFAAPQINETRVEVAGNDVDATEITVLPFATDANLAEFEGVAGKEYRFVYSEQIPGDLVSVRTRMSAADGTMLKEEGLRYGGIR
ncbi:MAG: hypothetical protein KDJ24_14455 [Gammaproteobacteria bacterium]|nr:hypothetical protein [Gammaproteobacteria bacterium]